jgi:hypothetical protein
VPTAYAIAFDGPAPTNINPERALVGTKPRPTHEPSVIELKKRQTGSSPETCGWVDGDFGMFPLLDRSPGAPSIDVK